MIEEIYGFSFEDLIALNLENRKLQEENKKQSLLLRELLEIADSRTHFSIYDDLMSDIRGKIRGYENV